MPKAESKGKPDEAIEDIQAELLRLQRQFRLLEDDRRAYRQEAEYWLRKQKETIHNLNLEHDELAKEHKLAASIKNQNCDAENTEKLRDFLAEEKLAKCALEDMDSKLDQVNREIKDMSNETDQLRQSMGGCKESESRCKAMKKLNRVMENRLNEANIKFNTALAGNSEMRQEIDHINIQRNRFESLHKKLTKMFQTGKEEKDFLIESSTALFNSRDEAEHRMQSLRERSERDMTQFNSELKDILRVIDHDKKLREFMSTKMEERGELYEAAVQGRKDKKLFNHIKALQVEVEHYESIFEQLIEVSGIENIDDMVNAFIQDEDENFASFNFVKEQNEEIQHKEAAILAFTQEIAAMGKEEITVDEKHNIIMKKLEEVEKKNKEEHEKVISQLKNENKILDKIRCSMDKTFAGTECNRTMMNDLLGGSIITNDNLLSYLGLIEQRATELTQAKTMISFKTGYTVTSEETEGNILSFATVGKVVRCLVAPPSILNDMPEVYTPGINETAIPLSQKDARQLVANITKLEREGKKY